MADLRMPVPRVEGPQKPAAKGALLRVDLRSRSQDLSEPFEKFPISLRTLGIRLSSRGRLPVLFRILAPYPVKGVLWEKRQGGVPARITSTRVVDPPALGQGLRHVLLEVFLEELLSCHVRSPCGR